MKRLKTCAGIAAAALLASLPQPAVAAGDIQIAKVNPENKAETRVMHIESAGRTVAVPVATTPMLTKADIRKVSAVTERAKVTSGARPETREVAAMQVSFTSEGSKKLAALAKEWKGKQIAVIIDGKLVATPVLNEADGGELIFTGNFTPEQGRSLAAEVNGKAPAPAAEPSKEKKKP